MYDVDPDLFNAAMDGVERENYIREEDLMDNIFDIIRGNKMYVSREDFCAAYPDMELDRSANIIRLNDKLSIRLEKTEQQGE